MPPNQEAGREASNPAPQPPGRSEIFRMDLGLFALSATVLTLEVLQSRIFEFSLHPLTIYLAIGVCLLGLGASATLLTILPRVPRRRVRELAALAAIAAAVAIPASHVVFAHTSADLGSDESSLILSLVTWISLTCPYFFLGTGIALLLVDRAASIGRAYAFNLAGSAAGCLIVFPMLDALGAESMLIALAGMALAAAWLLAPPVQGIARVLFALCVGGLLLAQLGADQLFAFRAYPPMPFETTRVLSRWDRIGKVEVYRVAPVEGEGRAGVPEALDTLFWTQNGGGGSVLMALGEDPAPFDAFFERTVYSAGYALGDVRDVLIIGLGGGPDLLNAVHQGVRSVRVAEINGTAIDLIRDDYAAFLGNPAAQPGVSLQRIDGRSLVRATEPASFDLIQMSGVDTKSILTSGSHAVNAMNYLYTRQSMGEILSRLRPQGMLAVIRPIGFQTNRMAVLAHAALEDLGVAEPERHMMVIGQGIWVVTLVRRTPFTAAEVERLHDWVRTRGSTAPPVFIRPYEAMNISLGKPMQIAYSPPPHAVARTPVLRALAAGRIENFVSNAILDLSPSTDDRPYFLFRQRPETALLTPGPMLGRLYASIAQLAGISVLFIVLPLVFFRVRGLRAPQAGRSLVYFSALGVAFMLVEIGLIQRFVLFLGHQSYAVTVVLMGLLAGASVGSSLSARLPLARRAPLGAAIAMLIAVSGAYAVGLPGVFEMAAAAPFGARLALSLVLLVFLGAWLGVPFPAGLRALERSSPRLLAWGVGINGFASVVGATAAVPIGMLAGLRVLLLAGVSLYALAILTAPRGVAPGGTAAP